MFLSNNTMAEVLCIWGVSLDFSLAFQKGNYSMKPHQLFDSKIIKGLRFPTLFLWFLEVVDIGGKASYKMVLGLTLINK